MYLEYEYIGSTQGLITLIQGIVQGFEKVHLTFVPQISSYLPNKDKDYEQIKNNILEIIEKCKYLLRILNDPKLNKDNLMIGLNYLGKTLEEYLRILQLPISKKYAARLLKEDAKLIAINVMMGAIIESEAGFTTLKKRHKNYPQVMRCVEFITVDNANQVEEKSQKMGNLLSMSSASVIQSLRHQTLFMRALSFPFNFMKYFVATDQAEIMVGNYLRKPDPALMQKLWNVGETECIINTGMKCLFDRIRTVKKIYIPRYLLSTNQIVDIFTKDEDKIQVRVISPHPIQLYGRSQCCGCLCCKSCLCCISSPHNNQPQFQTIMVHTHGGGFVALSSFSTQNHTRKWAKQFGMPIFSIDYRLTPQSSFPDVLDDCWFVYNFLVHHAHRFMNVRPTKILVGGDSAGGNLALSLTATLIKRNISPLPHGVYLAYPATDFRQKFSPSRIYSLDDTLLFATLLYACRSAYVGASNDTNPLVSPVLLTQGWINGGTDTRWPLKWPKTRLIVGQKDPLFDDTFELLERMVLSQIDVRCKVFEAMGHALLSLQSFIPQCNLAIEHSISQIRQLLE